MLSPFVALHVAAVALPFLHSTLAYPSPLVPSSFAQTIQLKRRVAIPSTGSDDELGVWAKNYRDGLAAKYGARDLTKRSEGSNLLIDLNADSSYVGSLAIGTPPVAFDVILDTGSADLWLADNDCQEGCSSISTFNAAASSTFVNVSKAFSITYGSGQAAGTLGQDLVQMAGFSVANQTFAVCDQVSDGLLTAPVSGLMGLAFQSISSSQATPFWQTLAESGAMDEPLMSFQLTRFTAVCISLITYENGCNNISNAKVLEAGGTFTMGFTNSSLFTGDIDYQSIPDGEESYWVLPITALTVQGSSITLPSGSDSYAAIDTGTTLVGGPSDAIEQIYAQIPNSEAGTGNYEGYWFYPCDTEVNVSISFGGQTWSISPADFKLAARSADQCMGAFFVQSGSGSAPPWIVGDTFLKNVYSVFRYNPAAVGFAALSDTALIMSNVDVDIPSPTLGSVSASVTATGAADNNTNGATPSTGSWPQPMIFALAAAATVFSTLL